jgi:ATP-binding cassette, subfamily B, bacterial
MEQSRNTQAIKLAINHYARQIKTDWRWSVPALLLPGFGNILVFLAPPLIVARIITAFNHTTHPSFTQLLPYILSFGGVWIIGELLWRLGMLALTRTEIRGISRLYANAMDLLFAKDQSFFNDHFAGSLTKDALTYARRYEDILDTLAFSITSSLLPILFAVFVLAHYSIWLVVALVSMMTITGFIVWPFIKRRQKMVDQREEAVALTSANVADTISNMSVVRSYASEDYEARRHLKNVQRQMSKTLIAWDYNTTRIDMAVSPLFVLTNTIGLAIALALSTNGALNIGAVFVSFSYFVQVSGFVWKFNQIYRNVEGSITEVAKFTNLLIEDPLVQDVAHPLPLSKPVRGSVEFKNVDFQYSDSQGHHLFRDLNLKIEDGEKVALVGHSGGGKTTVTMLLLRFMDINSGQILINGQDISQIKQRDLRSMIGYVPQDPSLFHRSLAENIRYGNLQATDQDVESVAKLAHATEFIKDLPQGFATLVGERGVKLSGGQRQRIAIARAMLKGAPILVLDEATSALDSASEKLIQDALWKLMEGRTAIVIAHRLSTIQKMDRIVVLDQGRIAEQGTHQELLAKKGIYAQLWAHQSGGFLED